MEVTHCGGMGAHFKKCWITTQSIAHIGQPNVITTRKVWIWKGKHDLLSLGKIM
jgi:hypothetical protein